MNELEQNPSKILGNNNKYSNNSKDSMFIIKHKHSNLSNRIIYMQNRYNNSEQAISRINNKPKINNRELIMEHRIHLISRIITIFLDNYKTSITGEFKLKRKTNKRSNHQKTNLKLYSKKSNINQLVKEILTEKMILSFVITNAKNTNYNSKRN